MGNPPSMFGGERPGQQASAEDLMALGQDLGFDVGTGAPIFPAGEVVFEPLLVSPTLMGNSEADDEANDGGFPTQPQMHVEHVGHGGRKILKKVPFIAGASVHYYLKQTRTTAIRSRCELRVGGKKVRMSYVPREGEHIVLRPARSALS